MLGTKDNKSHSMMAYDTYILIGYRGSGKTSVGTTLARRLGLAFIDVDECICQRFEDRTIREIWHQYGEPAFREVEVQVTRERCTQGRAVIGLGGGTLMQAGARQAVEQASNALRVYLRAEPSVLFERIQADPRTSGTRPNLTGLGGGVEEIEQMLAKREPVYRAVADREIDVTSMSVDEVVKQLLPR